MKNEVTFTTKSGRLSSIDGIARLYDENWNMSVQLNCTDILSKNHWSLVFSDSFANFSEDDFAEMLESQN